MGQGRERGGAGQGEGREGRGGEGGGGEMQDMLTLKHGVIQSTNITQMHHISLSDANVHPGMHHPLQKLSIGTTCRIRPPTYIYDPLSQVEVVSICRFI